MNLQESVLLFPTCFQDFFRQKRDEEGIKSDEGVGF